MMKSGRMEEGKVTNQVTEKKVHLEDMERMKELKLAVQHLILEAQIAF